MPGSSGSVVKIFQEQILGGEPVKIVDLARNMIVLNGLVPERDIEIKFTGLKAGEKMYEELFRAGDIRKDTGHSEIFAAVPAAPSCSSRPPAPTRPPYWGRSRPWCRLIRGGRGGPRRERGRGTRPSLGEMRLGLGRRRARRCSPIEDCLDKPR